VVDVVTLGTHPENRIVNEITHSIIFIFLWLQIWVYGF
jgi:hypothetical protein